MTRLPASLDRLINDAAKNLKKTGCALHFINDDQPVTPAPEICGCILQPRQIGRVFQIDVVCRLAPEVLSDGARGWISPSGGAQEARRREKRADPDAGARR